MPGVSMPNGVELYYNGYVFGVETEMVRVESRPNYDRAGRTVVSVTHSFTFKTTVVDTGFLGVSTSSAIADIRKRLSQPAGWFKMTGFGFGDLSVNNPDFSGVRDLKWGPKPSILSWDQVGADQAWKLTWRVEVTILDQCDNGVYRDKVMEFNYKVGYSTDRSGYSTRTYSGTLAIPNTRLRVGDRSVLDQADRWYGQVLPPVPTGFRRETRSHEIAEDKSSITFNVVDAEVRGYSPPPDVVFSRVQHSIRNDPMNFVKWVGTVTASYEMARGVPKSRSWALFWDLARERMNNAWKFTQGKNGGNGIVYPLTFSAQGGDLHSGEAGSYSLTFLLTLPMDANRAKTDPAGAMKAATTLLGGAAGLWLVPPGSSYKDWAASMHKGDVWHPRGYAKLEFSHLDDKLVDLCVGAGKVLAVEGDGDARLDDPAKKKISILPDGDERGERAPYNPFNVATPRPADSWLGFEQRLIVHQRDSRAVLVPLPSQAVRQSSAGGNIDAATGYVSGYAPDTPALVVQTRSSPVFIATLMGRAIRFGYEVTPPEVTRIGGVKAVPMNDGAAPVVNQRLIGNLGLPIVHATWTRRYVLERPPQVGLAAPTDPLFGGAVRAPGSGGGDTLEGFVVQG